MVGRFLALHNSPSADSLSEELNAMLAYAGS